MSSNFYKYSQYNIEIDHKNSDDTFLYNTYTSKGRWIPRSDLDDIKDKSNIDLGDVPIYLEQEGFIVPTSTDEQKYIQIDHDKAAYGSDILKLTIAVTRSCNYHCTYCFERGEIGTGNISYKVIDGIISFIEEKLKEHEFKKIKIVYFGGEPLLNISAIKEISKKIREITDISIHGHITTNGRLLTPELLEELKDCNIRSAQITLDGMPKEYAQLKGCTENDFYEVIENIKAVRSIIDTQIRINVGNNKESVKALIEYLYKEIIKCKTYIDNIKYLEHNKQQFMKDYQNYVDSYKDIMQFVFENGYESIFGNNLYPSHHCGACQANSAYYFAIDENGNLYKCVEFMFKEEFIIGNVFDGITVHELNNLFIDNPLYEKCKTCAYRPLCNGKCTTYRLITNKGINCEALQEWYRFRLRLRMKSIANCQRITTSQREINKI